VQAPRLIASDVDGTLLDPADRVPPRAVAAIARLRASGVAFVLVTGRPPRWIPPVYDLLGEPGLAVCANGAVLYDAMADRVLGATTLDVPTLTDLVAAVGAALPDAGLAVEHVGERAADDTFVADAAYRHAWEGFDSVAIVDRADLLERPAVKLLVRNVGLDSAAMAAALAPAVGDAADVTWSHPGGLIEMASPGITKAVGLAEVADRLGIAAADVLAFGDMPNDLEMLRWAGHGVAMGNAHPALKSVADEVTAGNAEDGVAEILERWF